ncbi:MAG: hypothetical protein ACREM8_11225, partial [Vulcanimicrobiaceae bacterium]
VLSMPAHLPVPASAPARERAGPGSIMALPSGSVASDIRPIEVDRRNKHATYEVLVANDSVSPVVAFAYAVGQSASGGAVSLSSFTVPPYTSVASEIQVKLPAAGTDPRVVVEILADSAHLTLDASPARRGRSWMRGAATPAVLTILALAGLGYLPNRPSVVALAGPNHVVAGQAFDVAYAARGARRLHYAVTRADGTTVSTGTLHGATGSFNIALPRTKHTTGYDVALTADGPLGASVRAFHVVAAAPVVARVRHKPVEPKIAHIAQLKLAASTVWSGKPVVVSYQAVADQGSVEILDQTGTVRASVPMAIAAGKGSATIVAPIAADDQEFRVVLHAQKGQTIAEQSVALFVHGDPALAALNGTIPPNIAVAEPVSGPEGSTTVTTASGVTVTSLRGGSGASMAVLKTAPFKVEQSSVRSGDLIHVAILDYESKLTIVLTAPTGDVIAAVAPKPGQTLALFRAPVVARTTKFSLLASFGRGGSQETFVHEIVIQPDSGAGAGGR